MLSTLSALALLAVFAVGMALALRAAPGGWLLDRLEIDPGTGAALTLDATTLGHPATGEIVPPLMTVRHQDGHWRLGAARTDQPVGVTVGGQRTVLQSWRLTSGDVIETPVGAIVVDTVETGHVALAVRGQPRRLDWRRGDLSLSGDERRPSCAVDGKVPLFADLRRSLRHRLSDRPQPALSIGGSVTCGERWAALPGLPPQALSLWSEGAAIWLVAGDPDLAVHIRPASQPEPRLRLSRLERVVDDLAGGVTELRVGGTTYAVALTDHGALSLRPIHGRVLLSEPPAPPQDGRLHQTLRLVGWLGEGTVDPLAVLVAMRPVGPLLAGLYLAVLILVATPHAYRRHRCQAVWPLAGKLVLMVGLPPLAVAASVLLALGWRQIGLEPLLMLTGAAWGWATLTQAASGRMGGRAGLLFVCLTAMAGIGLLALVQLAAGGPSDKGVDTAWKAAAMLTVVATAVATIAVVPGRAWFALLDRLVGSVLRFALPVVAVIGLVAQLVFGGEAGLGGWQPAELAKTALCLGLASISALFTHYVWIDGGAGVPWRRIVLWSLLTGVVLAVSILGPLVLVDDHSPVLVLSVAGIGWLAVFASQVLRERRHAHTASPWALAPLVAVVMLLVALGAAVGWLAVDVDTDADRAIDMDGKLGRLLVYWDPLSHRNSGYQVLESFKLLAAAPLMFDPAHAFGAAGPERALPEIENDFICALIASRFGLIACALLVAVQIIYVAVLADTAAACFRWRDAAPFAGQTGVARQHLVGCWLGYFLATAAMLQALHFLVGWGNISGLLPVMGLPSTWLSAGNSHALLFGLPVVIGAMVGDSRGR